MYGSREEMLPGVKSLVSWQMHSGFAVATQFSAAATIPYTASEQRTQGQAARVYGTSWQMHAGIPSAKPVSVAATKPYTASQQRTQGQTATMYGSSWQMHAGIPSAKPVSVAATNPHTASHQGIPGQTTTMYGSREENLVSRDELAATAEAFLKLRSNERTSRHGSFKKADKCAPKSQGQSEDPFEDLLRAGMCLAGDQGVQNAVKEAYLKNPELLERIRRQSNGKMTLAEDTIPALPPPEKRRKWRIRKTNGSSSDAILGLLRKIWEIVKNAPCDLGRIFKYVVCFLWKEIKTATKFCESLAREAGRSLQDGFTFVAASYGSIGLTDLTPFLDLTFGMFLLVCTAMRKAIVYGWPLLLL